MKRMFFYSFVLLVFGFSLFNFSALAVTAAYSTTQEFLNVLEKEDIRYSIKAIDKDGDEPVSIDWGNNQIFKYFFSEDMETTSLRVWNIITYNDIDLIKVLRVCNSLNCNYRYVCFSVDETDNTITAAIDIIHRQNDVGEIVWEATLHMINIIDDGYQLLSVYDK